MTAPTSQEEERRRRRPLLWLGALVVLLLIAGGATALVVGREAAPSSAASLPTSAPSSTLPDAVVIDDPLAASDGEHTGSATGTGVAASSLGLVVAARVSGAVAPGSDATLEVVVDNPLGEPVELTRATGRVTSATGGCRVEWYRIGRFSGSRRVAPGARTTLSLPVAFLSSPSVNQDACKGARYAFTVDVRARQA